MPDKTAIQIPGPVTGFAGDARLYLLSEPFAEARTGREHATVVVTALSIPHDTDPDAYEDHVIVYGTGADALGVPLRGSYRGGQDHGLALAGLGYRLERTECRQCKALQAVPVG